MRKMRRVPIARCPYCRDSLRLIYWSYPNQRPAKPWACRQCGEMTMQEADKPLYRYAETTLGPCWIVPTLQIWDENKDIRDSLLPVFLESEAAPLREMTPEGRQAFWKQRIAALAQERVERLKHPKRTSFVTEYMDPVKGTLEDVKAMFA